MFPQSTLLVQQKVPAEMLTLMISKKKKKKKHNQDAKIEEY